MAMEVTVDSRGQLCITRQFEKGRRQLTVDLFTASISFSETTNDADDSQDASSGNPEYCLGTIYGVIGCFHVPNSDYHYLLVITEVKELFTLPPPINKPVCAVSNISVIRIGRGVNDRCSVYNCSEDGLFDISKLEDFNLSRCPHHERPHHYATRTVPESFEPKLVREVRKMFGEESLREKKDFYFVPDGNLCSTYQRFCSEDILGAEEASEMFFWNKIMLQPFPVEACAVEGGFCVRLVHGFCSHFNMVIEEDDVSQNVPDYMRESFKFSQSKHVSVFLISRRSRHRAGRRYKRRGVDDKGFVANFVETETVFYTLDTKFFSSFVQIRGSIPLFWSHELNGVKYQPLMKRYRSVQDNNSAFKKHFDLLKRMYSTKIAIINLVAEDKEKLLWTIFAEAVLDLNSPDLYYISYDYHAHSKKAPADELEKYFLTGTRTVQNDIGFSYGDHQGMLRFQKGVHRINCVDCLDRTNVVQRWLAESVVKDVLVKIGCLLPEDNVPMRLKTAMKNLWHENGNAISRQYTGTDALKGDVTKTGKREMTGFLRDGVNSLERRYFMAQFRDSILQCTIDVLTMGFSDEAGFNFKSQLIEVAKKQIEQSDEFWSAWIMDHLESHIDVSSHAGSFRSKLLTTAAKWQFPQLTERQATPASIHVFVICRNNFYIFYVNPEKLKVVRSIKVPIADLDCIAFGNLVGYETDVCCLQITYPIATTAENITTMAQMTLKPVDFEDDVTGIMGSKTTAPSSDDLERESRTILSPNNEDESQETLKAVSEEYAKSRKIVDKIVEDFAKARSRLSLNIKVKSGQIEVTSPEELAEILAMRGQISIKKFGSQTTSKIKGFLSLGTRSEGPIERARSSEDGLNDITSSTSSKLSLMGSTKLLNKIKPRDLLPKLTRNPSDVNKKVLDDDRSCVDNVDAIVSLGANNRRQSQSETHLSSNDSILNIEIADDDVIVSECEQEVVNGRKISTITVTADEVSLGSGQAGGSRFTPVAVPEFVSTQHDHQTLVKRLQSKDCRTVVCFL